ncbi:DegV family protein [Peribacillus muralis]|uniref:DegV family protein n=1 Tax=Peribacillus muralis TaxID=264697 RepID=UPI001F4D37BF|nr:DegV family protein [Peribacillus muralis]MCK1991147.1 DegV family protein [Peribacillus muralis]MCK2011701.1 DegV family protein [Peribacillus muralis]
MNKIKIVTDSTVDMTPEELEYYDITMVPLSISIDGETFLDKVEIEQVEFLQRMNQAKELPKSSQPAVGTFVEVYDEIGSDDTEILSIHMTGGMSGTVRSAESAASMSDAKVTVFDSQFISKAMSFQVIEAAKLAKEGKSVTEIIERLEQIKKQSSLVMVIETLDNLVKGGRIGKVSALIGSLLHIKPIAHLEDGVLHSVSKARSQSQVVKLLIKKFKEDTEGKKVRGIGFVHVNGFAMADKVRQAISELSGFQDIKIEETTAVVSTHAGEGALAIMYYWD